MNTISTQANSSVRRDPTPPRKRQQIPWGNSINRECIKKYTININFYYKQ